MKRLDWLICQKWETTKLNLKALVNWDDEKSTLYECTIVPKLHKNNNKKKKKVMWKGKGQRNLLTLMFQRPSFFSPTWREKFL